MQNRILFACLAVLGFASALVATRWGVGLSPDSVLYIRGARSLAAGDGFALSSPFAPTEPITHHAPLYSALLAVGGWTGVDPMIGARWLGSLLFAANILLAALLVWRLRSGGSPRLWPALLVGLYLAFSLTMQEIHSMAWTEGLFIFLVLASFALLASYLESSRTWTLLLSAAVMALALLTRYAGVAFLAAAGLAILFFGHSPLRRRFASLMMYAVLGAAPLAAWMLRNLTLAGTATSRELVLHPPGLEHLRLAMTTVAGWLGVSPYASGWIKMFLLAALILLAAFSVRRVYDQGRRPPVLIRVFGLAIVVYAAFLLVSLTFFDANTPIDNRILSPIFVLGVISFFSLLGEIGIDASPASRAVVIIACGLVFIFAALPALRYTQNAFVDGIGFNNLVWRNSETISGIRSLPQNIPIYANLAEAVYVHTGRVARRLPAKFQAANQQPNPEYDTQLAAIEASLQNESGVIVYFTVAQMSNQPSLAELTQSLQLRSIFTGSDGVILAPAAP